MIFENNSSEVLRGVQCLLPDSECGGLDLIVLECAPELNTSSTVLCHYIIIISQTLTIITLWALYFCVFTDLHSIHSSLRPKKKTSFQEIKIKLSSQKNQNIKLDEHHGLVYLKNVNKAKKICNKKRNI